MEIIYDAVIAFLAAAGLFALIWMLAGSLTGAARAEAVVFPARGESVEELARPLLRVRRWHMGGLEILLPEDALTPPQLEEARRLAGSRPGVRLVALGELTARGGR